MIYQTDVRRGEGLPWLMLALCGIAGWKGGARKKPGCNNEPNSEIGGGGGRSQSKQRGTKLGMRHTSAERSAWQPKGQSVAPRQRVRRWGIPSPLVVAIVASGDDCGIGNLILLCRYPRVGRILVNNRHGMQMWRGGPLRLCAAC